ncbi:MAG: hypothetical protein CL927_20890 [Deltaproteobacteria bacterium]|nr:hypothetical protein [Deltaproteobacteria bacterium]HCH64381.1 hypothetical protein [Deltaproteobacteria bacterium]
MFASVGRGSSGAGGRTGASIRLLLLFLAVAFLVVALERWWTGPPPIPPVSVQMMAKEAALAAEEVDALGGLVPLPPEPEKTP